jgi:hypothetical protein
MNDDGTRLALVFSTALWGLSMAAGFARAERGSSARAYTVKVRFKEWVPDFGYVERSSQRVVPLAEPTDLDADQAAVAAALVDLGAPEPVANLGGASAAEGDWFQRRVGDREFSVTF